MSTELLNCPFCGAEAEICFNQLGYQVSCAACLSSTDISLDKTETIAAWNRRAPTEQPTKKFGSIYMHDSAKADWDSVPKESEQPAWTDKEILELGVKYDYGWGIPDTVVPFKKWERDGMSLIAFARALLSKAPKVPDGFAPPYAEIYVGAGRFAICDWIDFDTIKQFNWRLTTRNRFGNIEHGLYAQAWDSESPATRNRTTMHKLIMNPTADLVIDHINGDGLDNRRINLRVCLKHQNSMNQRSSRGSSKFKGVAFEKSSKCWRAYITCNGKRDYLGRHECEEDAAKAYNKAAITLFGQYAKLNEV